MTTFAQWRAWIGPRWREKGTAGASLWATISSGAITPVADTTLAAALNDGATTATLTSASTWPASNGWAYIGPNGTSQAWEYIDYSSRSGNALSGITREPSAGREHNGQHSSGAVARLFWPLTTDNGQLTISYQADANLAAQTWTAQIAGVSIPAVAIRNSHLILIQTRTADSEPNGAWSNYLVGWIQTPRTRDDYRQRAEWTISIVPATGMVGGAVIDGIRAGEIDLAQHGSATGDTNLADPFKELNSGDFIAADPGLEPSNVVDGAANTLWIGERVIGTPDTAGYIDPFDEGGFFSQIFINRWPGDTRANRWVEFFCNSGTIRNLYICTGTGSAHLVGFNGVSAQFGQRIIICEDRATFEADHPLANPLKILTVSSAWFDTVLIAGDCLGLRSAETGSWGNTTIAWGNGATRPRMDDNYGPEWSGATITAPAAGQVIRYYYTAGQTWPYTQYRTDYLEHAGYSIDDGTDPYLLIGLPGLGLSIADDMTNSSPGSAATLQIVDESGSGSTGGLPASGTIQIAQEQITYSSKTAIGIVLAARGANSTTAAAHAAGDKIYVIDSTGTATDGQPIRQIAWRRRTGGSVPARFYLYRSGRDTVRAPGQSGYTSDYEELASVSGHSAATYTLNLSPPRRTRHVLLQFEYMTQNPGRPRMNDIEAYINESDYSADTWLTGSPTAAAVIAQVLINAGIATEAITQEAGTAEITGFSTGKEQAWKVAADLADYAGAWIRQALTSLITISQNTLWTAGSFTPSQYWTRANVKAVEIIQTMNRAIGQVKIAWRTPDGTESGVESYPATVLGAGAPIEYEEAIYANATAAQAAAQRRFVQSRYQYQIAIECAEGDPAIQPGEIHSLEWQFAADMQPITRTVIVIGVDHQIADMQFQTVLTCIQSERDSYT